MSATSTTEQAATTGGELELLLAAAEAARVPYAHTAPGTRAALLESVADVIDAHSEDLIETAMAESHLPRGRLQGEVRRTTFQLRLFGETVRSGAYVDARIDTPDPAWPSGPRPDIRSMLFPVGPALNFAASNFPFAFSVAGGDTASGLAAGCPVVVKAHPAHPELSRRIADIVSSAVEAQRLPPGVFAVIFGDEVGRQALVDHRIKVGTFTGSPGGGRALYDLANSRKDPIPFFAEMGSVNPVFVTPDALTERLADVAKGFVESFTLGVGQFCTKPGVLVLPAQQLERFVQAADEVLATIQPATMLTGRIRESFADALTKLQSNEAVRVLVEAPRVGDLVGPSLLTVTAKAVISSPELLSECFGPASMLISCDAEQEYIEIAKMFTGELTASIQLARHDKSDVLAELLTELERISGRIVFNQWPTGVAVTHAMVHGGPYPATTNFGSTSVGTTSVGRFLRRIAFQNGPDYLLPDALRNHNPLRIPRTLNGVLEPA